MMLSKVLVALCVVGAYLADSDASAGPAEGRTLGAVGSSAPLASAAVPYPYAHTYHAQEGGYSFELGSPGAVPSAVVPQGQGQGLLAPTVPYSWPLVAASGSWVVVALKGVLWVVQHVVVLALGGILLVGFCKLTPFCHKLHRFHKHHKLSEVDLARAQHQVDKAVHKYESNESNQDVPDEDLEAEE